MNAQVSVDNSKELIGVFKILLKSTDEADNAAQLAGLERAALELQEVITATRYRPRLPDVTRYLSKVRDGYDTVLGYMAKNHPHELDGMIDAVKDTIDLCRACSRITFTRREDTFVVEACEVLQYAGITAVQSYPVSVIEEALNS